MTELVVEAGGDILLEITANPAVINAGSGTGVKTQHPVPALVWTVNHNQNKPCLGRAFTNFGEQVGCDVEELSENTMRFTFTTPFSGYSIII